VLNAHALRLLGGFAVGLFSGLLSRDDLAQIAIRNNRDQRGILQTVGDILLGVRPLGFGKEPGGEGLTSVISYRLGGRQNQAGRAHALDDLQAKDGLAASGRCDQIDLALVQPILHAPKEMTLIVTKVTLIFHGAECFRYLHTVPLYSTYFHCLLEHSYSFYYNINFLFCKGFLATFLEFWGNII
jgi:hypothetical protein